MREFITMMLFLLVSVFGSAQDSTDIFLFKLKVEGESLEFTEKFNITQRAGYDNQPSFSPDSKFLYYTSKYGDQTDIYRYDVAKKSNKRFTKTDKTSEYSPEVMPDKSGISVVRVEEEGAQRLWKFSMEGDKPSLLNKKIDSVGYYNWMDKENLMLFLLGPKIHTMHSCGYKDKKTIQQAENIGRCMQSIPGERATSFTQKKADGSMSIMRAENSLKETSEITKTLEGSEDYVWLPGGIILMGKGSKLYTFNTNKKDGWKEVATFNHPEIKNITRMAIGPYSKRLAIVTDD
jgi:dipeptidyl aminopeptidase/acylaminoacyl peptidase